MHVKEVFIFLLSHRERKPVVARRILFMHKQELNLLKVFISIHLLTICYTERKMTSIGFASQKP